MQLHPLSAVRDAGRNALAVGSTVFFVVAFAAGTLGALDVSLALILAPLGAFLGAAYGIAHYLRFEYELTPSTLAIRSGVVARTDRSIPLGRVQNVDLQTSFLQRLFGVSVVRIETAGGGQTEAVLDFVSTSDAKRLQREIRERSAAEPAPADEPGIDPLFSLQDSELALYALTTFRPQSLLVLLVALPVGWNSASDLLHRLAALLGAPPGTDIDAFASAAGVLLVLVGGVLAVAAAWALSFLVSLAGYYGFQLGRTGDDLVYERGLIRRYSGSIPLGKVQTLTLVEHLLVRWLGYAGLRIETAGYAPGRGGGRRANGPASAVPLTRRERALTLARSIESFETLDALTFSRPPTAARRRYLVRYSLVVVGLTVITGAVAFAVGGWPYWPAPLGLLVIVPAAAHLKWRHRGVHLGEDHIAIRDGFWRRRTRIVPYARLQTIETRATIFQRRLHLASVLADTADSATRFGSDAVAYDLDAAEATHLHATLRERLGTAVCA